MAPRRSWAKADQPVLVEPCCGLVRRPPKAETYCRNHDLSTTSLMRWARHLVIAEDLRKRTGTLRNLPRKRRNGSTRKSVEAPKEASALSLRRAHGQRSDRSSGVLGHACRGDELQRHGACRVCRSARSFAAFAAHLARSPGTIRQRNGLARPASSECPGQLSSAALFRSRVQFGLTARKGQQLAAVILADGAANQVPVLSTSRDLVRPPDGMTAIMM